MIRATGWADTDYLRELALHGRDPRFEHGEAYRGPDADVTGWSLNSSFTPPTTPGSLEDNEIF